jgi:hypothetical protein
VTQPPIGVPEASTRSKLVSRHVWIDLLIAAALVVGSGVWATRFWNSWTAQGGEPVFYQNYFEPAVMVACGKGFVASQPPRPQALEDFLNRRRDSFDCRDIPSSTKLGSEWVYQGAWLYLEMTVGWAWRVLGISWSRMGPLFGLLFGIVIGLIYGIFRFGMGRLLGVVCALGVATSYTHLINLPHLRDYAKAPFTLALVLILGIIVTRPLRRRTLLLMAVAYGAVLGIGYGFRTDFLANLPVLAIVLFIFLDGGVARNLGLKAAATALYLVTFLIVSWPISSLVYQKGGCQWHVALLGLQSPFDESLHVAPAPYDFGNAYSDGYIYWTVFGYAHRMQPASERLAFCSHEYDVQSGRYLKEIALSFPADLIARAYAAVLQIAELPFLSWASPLKGWATTLYDVRSEFLRPKIGWGVYVLGAALLLASAVSFRLGFFLLFFVAYFGGYPAIQFQDRHHFHLEFMTWWAFGFVAHQTIAAAWSLKRRLPDVGPLVRGAGRSVAFVMAAIALIVGSLDVARWYQRRQAQQLFAAYLAAPKIAVETPSGALPSSEQRAWPEFLEVDLNEAACGPRPAVTFRHNATSMAGDLSRTMTIARRAAEPGLTRIVLPVFEPYKGLEFSDLRPGCVVGAYRFADLRPFPLLLGAVLPPDWKDLPLYQRLRDWELNP